MSNLKATQEKNLLIKKIESLAIELRSLLKEYLSIHGVNNVDQLDYRQLINEYFKDIPNFPIVDEHETALTLREYDYTKKFVKETDNIEADSLNNLVKAAQELCKNVSLSISKAKSIQKQF